jgi:hypothetical protein
VADIITDQQHLNIFSLSLRQELILNFLMELMPQKYCQLETFSLVQALQHIHVIAPPQLETGYILVELLQLDMG